MSKITDLKLKEHCEQIKDLESHSDIANKEMGIIKIDIGIIKTKLENIEKTIVTIENKIWLILTTIIIGILIQIALKI